MALTLVPIDLVTPKPSIQKLSTYKFCGVLKAGSSDVSLAVDNTTFSVGITDRVVVFLGGVHQQDYAIMNGGSSVSFGEAVSADLGYEILVTRGFATDEIHNVTSSSVPTS